MEEKWKPIKDNLPPPGNHKVLAYTPNEDASICYRLVDVRLIKTVSSATHWMLLPEPPEVR